MASIALMPAATKRLATLIAQLALVGVEVHVLADGGYLLLVRGQTRHCRTLGQLEAAAQRLGVPT